MNNYRSIRSDYTCVHALLTSYILPQLKIVKAHYYIVHSLKGVILMVEEGLHG